MRPTINSLKHVNQHSIDTTAVGLVDSTTLVNAVDVADADASNEVRVGAIVKALYHEMWIRGEDAAVGSSYVYIIEKAPAAATSPTAGIMAALDTYVNKKNVLFTSQGLVNAVEGVATPVIRSWIKIPKGKQRMAQGDKMKAHVFAQSGALLRCGVTIFKEYF